MGNEDEVLILDKVAYGMLLPVILVFGTFGSIMNLAILHSAKLKAAHFVYMKGMSTCDLLVMITTIPFAIRSSQNRKEWNSAVVAWYYAHLAFCHPFKARSLHLLSPRHAHVLTVVLPVVSCILYIPYTLRSTVEPVTTMNPDNSTTTVYKVEENCNITTTIYYIFYNYSKEVIFRLAPALVLVVMNICIILTYHRASTYLRRRQFMKIRVSQKEVCELKEGRRLMLVLGGLSIQFVICTAPAAVLAILVDDQLEATSYWFAIFRAIANLLEISKNATTFLVYCLCSGEYRHLLVKWFAKPTAKVHGVIRRIKVQNRVQNVGQP